MILGGVILFFSGFFIPTELLFLPPLDDAVVKRVVFCALSLLYIPLGIGFCLRSKTAWWGFFAVMLVGIIWHVIAGILNPHFAFLAILSPVLNIPIATGIFFVTKPAFLSKP